MTPCIVFEVAGTSYAVPALDVHRMEMVEQITAVPNAPPFVDGLVYTRGNVIPVVNLRARFGFERVPFDLRARIVVVQIEQRLVGLAVDAAREFTKFDMDLLAPAPPAIVAAGNEAIRGVLFLGQRMVLLLDTALLLKPQDTEVEAR